MADVLAELHAVEANTLDGIVRAAARHLHRVAERGDAQPTPAVGEHALALEARPGVEHPAIVGRPRQAFDAIALARLLRVAVRGEHHPERRAPVPAPPR